MTTPFGKASDFASGSTNFFRPKELALAVAVIIETRTVLDNQVREYKGVQTGVGTDVIADLTVFENQAMLDGTLPPTILKGVRVDKDAISDVLSAAHAAGTGTLAVRVVKATSRKTGNQYWAIEDLADTDSLTKVQAYYDARTEAAASAPSFD